MSISRRRFAQTAGLAMIASGLAGSPGSLFAQTLEPGGLFSLSSNVYADPVLGFTSETFLPYINTIFQPAGSGNRRIPLQLTEVLTHSHKENQRREISGESFSLLFRAVGGKALPQSTHTFEHASLGTFSLFISPAGCGGNEYVAVINHLVFH